MISSKFKKYLTEELEFGIKKDVFYKKIPNPFLKNFYVVLYEELDYYDEEDNEVMKTVLSLIVIDPYYHLYEALEDILIFDSPSSINLIYETTYTKKKLLKILNYYNIKDKKYSRKLLTEKIKY